MKCYYIHWVLVQVYISGLSYCVNKLELLTLTEHPSSLSGVRVTRSLGVCVCFVDRCLSFFVVFALAIVLSVLLRFTLRILITPLVSSNYSSNHTTTRRYCLVPTHCAYNGYVSLDSLIDIWIFCCVISINNIIKNKLVERAKVGHGSL